MLKKFICTHNTRIIDGSFSLGNPDELVDTKPVYNSCHQTHPTPSESALSSWREQPNLRLLNLLYDVTPSKYITLVVTEVGLIPCTSAPVVSDCFYLLCAYTKV